MANNPDLKNHPRLSMTTMKPVESSSHSHCDLYLTKGHQMYKKNDIIIPGFKLPINLVPKPNRITVSKPIRVNGILTSKVIK